MAVMYTPAASVVLMRVITVSNDGHVDTGSERGGDGGDHY